MRTFQWSWKQEQCKRYASFAVQSEAVVNINGERIENASDEEESEEVDSEETEEPVSAVEETSEPISQVRAENISTCNRFFANGSFPPINSLTVRELLCLFVVKEGEEPESEQSGDGEAEEEGTESDLVGSKTVNQANGVDIQQHFSCLSPCLRKILSPSELRVEFEEEIKEENKSRQCLAQAIKEKTEKDKGQRWFSHH